MRPFCDIFASFPKSLMLVANSLPLYEPVRVGGSGGIFKIWKMKNSMLH